VEFARVRPRVPGVIRAARLLGRFAVEAREGSDVEGGRYTANRRVSNGEQTQCVAHLAMKRGPSVDFSGYWRHIKTETRSHSG